MSITSYRFIATQTNDQGGISVASAGDVDGDGKDDLIIGTPITNAAQATGPSGETYLLTAAALAAADAADGSVDGVINLDNVNEQTGSYQLIGFELSDGAGASVASAGDVDGDGLDDLLIGAPISFVNGSGLGINTGATYLLTAADLAASDAADGSADGVINLGNVNEQTASYKFIGADGADNAGSSVASVGDIDGDGKDDFIIGAAFAGDGFPGEAYLVTAAALAAADAADGSADGVISLSNINEQTGSYQFVGADTAELLGAEVSSAGDVDGDGKDDLLISAPLADGGGTRSGEVYLVTAANLATSDTLDTSLDGVIDLDNVNEQTGSYQFVGADAGDFAGLSVASAGDIDGDGLADLIIAAQNADGGGSNSGEVYLVNAADLAAADAADGSADGVIDLDNVNEQTGSYQFVGADAGDNAGFSVASAGDVDGDDLGDLIIGAQGADGGGNGSGEAYLVTAANLFVADAIDGSLDGVIDLENITAASGSYRFIGADAGDNAGSSVASAGDVDGDGLDDLLIGARGADAGGPDAGEAYLANAADLAAADAADGSLDGVIDLGFFDNIDDFALA